jgi:hypothetical protein
VWVYELVAGIKVSRLEVVPGEAEVVERMFQDTVSGVSQRALARALTKEGIPSATGIAWTQSSVAVVLKNPLYKGMVRHNGEVFPGAHEPIVTAELWDRAEAIRSSTARRAGGRHPKGSHLLVKGMLKCGTCGHTMNPRTDPYRPYYQVYQCSGRIAWGVESCSQGFIHRTVVDDALLADLREHYIDMEATRRQIEAKTSADLAIAREALHQAETDLQMTEQRLARIQRGYQDGVLDDDDYREKRSQLLEERKGAQMALERATEHVQAVERAAPLSDAEEHVLRRLAELKRNMTEGVEQAPDLNALRNVIAQLFEKVMLLPADHPYLTEVAGMKDSGPELEGGYYLVPFLRDETVEDGALDRITIRKAALALETDQHSLPFGCQFF